MVVITTDLKSSAQCIVAEQKAQIILGYIKRVFRYRNKQTVLALYRALVLPLLEYSAQFWSPIRRVDVERLEKVQARDTKLVPSIRHKGYQRKLADFWLFTLEQRRLRGLLIETFKILRVFSGLYPAFLFELSVNRTRNHGFKMVPPRFNTVLYRDFPMVRMCNLWNSLPEAVVNAPSVDGFKRRLDNILPSLASCDTQGLLACPVPLPDYDTKPNLELIGLDTLSQWFCRTLATWVTWAFNLE